MAKRVASVAALVGLLGLALAGRLVFRDTFDPKHLLAELRALGASGTAIWAYAGVYLLATSALLPSAVLHVVAGAMWGFSGGLWPNLILANLVGHLHFGIGRWLGRERMRALLVRRGWTAAIDELERSGVLTVLVLRQTPIPFMATNLVCGASPITWRQFVVGHFIGLLPGVLIWTWSASELADGVDGAKDAVLVRLGIVAICTVVLALATRVGMSVVRRRRETA